MWRVPCNKVLNSRVLNQNELEAVWHGELLEQLENKDPELAAQVLNRLEGNIPELARSPIGSQVVKNALQHSALCNEKDKIIGELHGHTSSLIVSPFGAEVLICALKVAGPAMTSFIAEELASRQHTTDVARIARTESGSRVIRAALDHLPGFTTWNLVKRVLAEANWMCFMKSGSEVLKQLWDHVEPTELETRCSW